MYLIKYIFVNGVYYSYRILFIAVSIKNIVDMCGNKQFVQLKIQQWNNLIRRWH